MDAWHDSRQLAHSGKQTMAGVPSGHRLFHVHGWNLGCFPDRIFTLVVLVAPGEEIGDLGQIGGFRIDPHDQGRHPDFFVALGGGQLGALRDHNRALNLLRVPADGRTVLIEDVQFVGCFFRSAEAIPHIGILGHQFQGHLFATPTNQDREGVLDRGRIQFGQTVLDDREIVTKITQAIGRSLVGEVVLGVVLFVPAGTNPEDEATTRDMVQGAGHIGEEVGIAVAVAGHQWTEADPAGDGAEGCEEGETLVVKAIPIALEWEEMIPDVDIVDPGCFGREPGVSHFIVGRVLGFDGNAYPAGSIGQDCLQCVQDHQQR